LATTPVVVTPHSAPPLGQALGLQASSPGATQYNPTQEAQALLAAVLPGVSTRRGGLGLATQWVAGEQQPHQEAGLAMENTTTDPHVCNCTQADFNSTHHCVQPQLGLAVVPSQPPQWPAERDGAPKTKQKFQ